MLDTAVCLINCMCRQSLERCMIKVNSAMFMLMKSKMCVCGVTHRKVHSVRHLQRGHRRGLLWEWETCDCMWGYVALLNWYCGMCSGFHFWKKASRSARMNLQGAAFNVTHLKSRITYLLYTAINTTEHGQVSQCLDSQKASRLQYNVLEMSPMTIKALLPSPIYTCHDAT